MTHINEKLMFVFILHVGRSGNTYIDEYQLRITYIKSSNPQFS